MVLPFGGEACHAVSPLDHQKEAIVMPTAPGTHDLGTYRLRLNKNHAVVIYCDLHKVWLPAANATGHFTFSRDHKALR